MKHINADVHDQVENYSCMFIFAPRERQVTDQTLCPVNRDVTKREHPEALRPLLPEIREFSRHNHFNVLHPLLRFGSRVYPSWATGFTRPLLRLLALGMELPEETFVNVHGWDAVGETYGASY